MNNSKRRLSQHLTSSAYKLKLDSVNKVLKIDRRQKKDAIIKQVSRVALSELLKNTSINTTLERQEPPDFKTFLSQKENIEIFRDFLKAQYCHENLEFYLACERYRNLGPNGVGKELVKFLATQIYNDFLGDNARQPVNVSDSSIQAIKKHLKEPQPNLLLNAQNEIYELMRTDCYPRFCKTWQIDKDLAQKILSQGTPPQAKPSNQSYMASSFMTEQSLNASHVNASLTSPSTATSPSASSLIPPPPTASRRASLRHSSVRFSKVVSIKISSECPPDCPYFRIGRLPCSRHNEHGPSLVPEQQVPSHKRKLHDTNPLYGVDLKKIHRLPTVCTEQKNGLPPPPLQFDSSPSPPPLPPKPENVDMNLISKKKYCPYVGKVFNV